MRTCELLLKHGFVIDPANNLAEICDIAITDGIIVDVGENLLFKGETTLHLDGKIITPGLIDMHCHCYPCFPVHPDGLSCIQPDAHMFQSGVTTAVDAGTCGIDDFPLFQAEVIEKSNVRILAFLNIANGGMVHMESEQEPSCFLVEEVTAMAKFYKEHIVGIKTAHYWVNKAFDASHTPWVSIDATIQAAQKAGIPCMIDFQPTLPERTYPKLLERLRPGDIHTHMYAKQFPVLNEDGQVNDFLFRAKEKGIKFDLGHGAGSFMFKNAIPSFAQNHLPDTLSTDLYADNVAGPVINLLHIMSKYLNIGMPLNELVARTTCAPAQVLHRPALGHLSKGACADIAVLHILKGDFGFMDSEQSCMRADKRLECVLTVRAGEIVYNPYAYGAKHWDDPL